MKLFQFIVFYAACFILQVQAETFFIVTDEKYEGTTVELGQQAREGILDGLFEAGHIVLDDSGIKNKGDILNEASVSALMKRASDSGMPFLVVVRVESKKNAAFKGGEQIESVAEYSLYDVAAKKLAGKGKLGTNNRGREKDLPAQKLWFSLGEDIASKIDSWYTEYRKKSQG